MLGHSIYRKFMLYSAKYQIVLKHGESVSEKYKYSRSANSTPMTTELGKRIIFRATEIHLKSGHEACSYYDILN